MILILSLSRALVLSGKPHLKVYRNDTDYIFCLTDRQVFVYTLPALDIIPSNVYRPIRNVFSLAVDELQLQRGHRAAPSLQQASPVGFCAIKRQSVSIYHLREKPLYDKVEC